MDQQSQVAQMQNQLNLAVVQMLQQQIQKTCFDKCFTSNGYPDSLQKSDQICLAKCMDRMIEAHSIVVKHQPKWLKTCRVSDRALQ